MRRHGVRAERPGTLAGPDGRVDPGLLEEPLGDVGELRRERRVRVEHELRGFVPPELGLGIGDATPCGRSRPAGRRPAAGPSTCTTAAGCRSGPDDRVDERLHRGVARFVREVAARDPTLVRPQPVGRCLVGQQRVEHECTGAQPRRETLGDRRGRGRGARRGRARTSFDKPCSSATVSPSSSRVIAEVSSLNNRDHALAPVMSFSTRIFSSGSVSRCGR